MPLYSSTAFFYDKCHFEAQAIAPVFFAPSNVGTAIAAHPIPPHPILSYSIPIYLTFFMAGFGYAWSLSWQVLTMAGYGLQNTLYGYVCVVFASLI